jgi:uncharacterized protein YkwD
MAARPKQFKTSLIVTTLAVLFSLFLIILFSATTVVDAQLAVVSDRQAALEALARLNEWRLEEGLLPFKMNDTLEDLAFYQADYVRTLRPIPSGSAIHVGRSNEGIRVRALYEQFSWEYYGTRDRVAIAEIAAVNNIDKAMAFWKSSPPHRSTVTNAGYREIGIVALPHAFGHIYIAVLGSRPDVLPALVHPETRELHLGRDLSNYATWPVWLTAPTQYRLFNKDGSPMSSNWLNYESVVALPKEAEERIYVMYSDGEHESMSEVDLERDIIVLPGYYPPPDPLVIPLVIPTAAPTATPEPPRPEILLVYDRRSLSIVSQSRGYQDWSNIDLVSPNFTLTLDSVAQGMAGVGLYYFPAGDCLMVWAGSVESVSPRKPSQCGNMRRGRSNLTASQRFWIDQTFTVERDGELLATCEPDARTCEVDLP